jgi:D-3-phosphoglycerate dehydrogenase
MTPFILISDGFDKNLFEKLRNNEKFQVHPQSKVSENELKALLPKVEGLVIRSATKVTPEILEKAPQLKYIIRAGAGTDNIDKKSCALKGVKVSNTPGANTNAAAEHAMALMFTLLRKTAEAHYSMKNGHWEKSKYSGNELFKKKIGILGMGRIGQTLAKRLRGFEPEISFYDPYDVKLSEPNIKQVETMEQIFSHCDIISMHLPFLEKTKNIINYKLLSLMKKNALLINASRGGILVEDDLIRVLEEEKIGGAALDVYSAEPLAEDSKLRKTPNLVLTPHLGASTEESQERVGEMVLNQLDQFFIHNKLINEVTA